jgi:hypothetical protein
LSYDTLTAYIRADEFKPDPYSGWKPVPVQAHFDTETSEILHEDKWVWNEGGYGFTLFQDGRLQLQVSLPRVVKGDNVIPWLPGNRDDMLEAISILDDNVSKHIGSAIPLWHTWGEKSEGGIYRLDAVNNFELPGEHEVLAVLTQLQKRRIPHHRRSAHVGESNSVMWEGATRRYVCYSKAIEILEQTGDKELARGAEGILRAEARAEHSFAVNKILKHSLKLNNDKPVAVSRVLQPDIVPKVTKAILGRLPQTVIESVGYVTMKNVPGIEDIVKRVGLVEASKAIGINFLYQVRSEEWLRKYLDGGNYARLMGKLKKEGLDPRSVNLKLSQQLRLIENEKAPNAQKSFGK